MSLTAAEQKHVQDQIVGVACAHCDDSEIVVGDHGMSKDEWGVKGAYVMCTNCGHELHKEPQWTCKTIP